MNRVKVRSGYFVIVRHIEQRKEDKYDAKQDRSD